MFPIFLNAENRGISFAELEERMISICNEHIEANRAFVFAFILYNFNHAYISKVLEDPVYWRSLNEISGDRLTVFSLHYDANNSTTNMGYMSDTNTSMNLSHANNLLVRQYFGDIHIKYPAILFFQVNNDSIIDSMLVELKSKYIEKSFNELTKIIQKTIDSLESVERNNKGNREEIFDLVIKAIEPHTLIIKVYRAVLELGKAAVLQYLLKKFNMQ